MQDCEIPPPNPQNITCFGLRSRLSIIINLHVPLVFALSKELMLLAVGYAYTAAVDVDLQSRHNFILACHACSDQFHELRPKNLAQEATSISNPSN